MNEFNPEISRLKAKIELLEFRLKFCEDKVRNLIKQLNDGENFKKEVETEKNTKKRFELEEALKFLKSKEVKTKQDQISIYTLEVILKGMK